MNNSEATYFLMERKNKVILPDRTYRDAHNTAYVATMMYGLVNLGYTFSSKLFDHLSKHSKTDIDNAFESIIGVLNQRLGNDVVHRAMYPNFPRQVMEAHEVELLINAIMHYWSGGNVTPVYEKLSRQKIEVKKFDELKVIDLGKTRDFFEMFTAILKSKTSISQRDVAYLEWYMSFFPSVFSLEIEKITMKEIVAVYSGLIIKHLGEDFWFKYISDHITNPNDVLRIATYLSGGDVSLSTNTEFTNMPRSIRRLLIQLLDNFAENNFLLWVMVEMKPHFKKWIRLGEVLHPFEDRYSKYKGAIRLFDFVRNNVHSVKTYNSLVEKYFNQREYGLLVSTLREKPTMYARNLNRIINTMEHVTTKKIVMDFCEVIDKVSTTVLINMVSHFSSLMNMRYRVFFPKSNVGKVYGMVNNLPLIDKYTVENVIYHIKLELIKRFSKLESLGNVYINPNLSKYAVPFSQRSASESLMGLTRGSKFEFSGNILRFFIYWENNMSRVDLDLSVTFYDENFNIVNSVWYRNLRNRFSTHSGDFVSGENGVSEFVDIDVQDAVYLGAVYAVPNLISFTGQGFKELEKCYIGWMERNDMMSGEIYEPSTVVDKINVSSDSQTYIPVVLDLKNREAVVADISVAGRRHGNQASNLKMLKWVGLSLMNSKKMNVKELLELHATARGKIVDNIEDADTVFLEGFGLETDVIVSEFL